MSTYVSSDSTPVTSASQLEEHFRLPHPSPGKLGVEWELLPVNEEGRLVPFFGARGVEALLKRLRSPKDGIIEDNGHLIALELPDGGMFELEPGGQVELAAPPKERLADTQAFLRSQVARAEKNARSLGFRLAPWALAPLNAPEDNDDVPKSRYRILASHLRARGDRGRWMMKLTAATQITLDYEDEAHLAEMVRALLPILPYLTALTANAPVYGGRPNGWQTLRPGIWQRTDPDRCGLPDHLFSEGFGFRSLVDYGLSRPAVFFVRDGQWVPGGGRTFAEILDNPGELGPITIADWRLHNTAIFTDLRMRGYLEIRTLDALPLPLIMACAALFKGLLGRRGGQQWAEAFPRAEAQPLRTALLDAGRLGTAWRPQTGPGLFEGWKMLLDAAMAGLAAQKEPDSYLAPLEELAREKRSPSMGWVQNDDGLWQGPELGIQAAARSDGRQRTDVGC